jgi:hypothetical protein
MSRLSGLTVIGPSNQDLIDKFQNVLDRIIRPPSINGVQLKESRILSKYCQVYSIGGMLNMGNEREMTHINNQIKEKMLIKNDHFPKEKGPGENVDPCLKRRNIAKRYDKYAPDNYDNKITNGS